MREILKRVQARARALARSGKFAGWRAIAFELRFEPDCLEGLDWFHSPAAQEEIDRLPRGAGSFPLPAPRRSAHARAGRADLRSAAAIRESRADLIDVRLRALGAKLYHQLPLVA